MTMNETLKQAIAGFVALNGASLNSEEGEQWASEYGLDVSDYSNKEEISSFFKAITSFDKDDKYISQDFLIRNCPVVTPDSYYVSLFKKFEIKRVVMTTETKSCLISSLMVNGYKAESVKIELTKSWGEDNYWADRNKAQYGHGILLTID